MNIPEGATHYRKENDAFYMVLNSVVLHDGGICKGDWVRSAYTVSEIDELVKSGIVKKLPDSAQCKDKLLDECAKILKERGEQYQSDGSEERSFGAVATSFSAITGIKIEPDHVCLLLGLLKDVRQFSQERYHHDSAVDGINYRVLLACERKERLGGGK